MCTEGDSVGILDRSFEVCESTHMSITSLAYQLYTFVLHILMPDQDVCA